MDNGVSAMNFDNLKKPKWYDKPAPAEEWAKIQAILEAQDPSDFSNFFVSFITGIVLGFFLGASLMYVSTPSKLENSSEYLPAHIKSLGYHTYVKDENITMRGRGIDGLIKPW